MPRSPAQANLRLSAGHPADFHRASERRYRRCRRQTVRRSKPADHIQMRLRLRDFRAVGREWARKEPPRPYAGSSATRSADCRCHIEWPAASIRQSSKARHGPGLQRSSAGPRPQVLAAPDRSGQNGTMSGSRRRGAERALRGSLLPLQIRSIRQSRGFSAPSQRGNITIRAEKLVR